MTRHAPPPAQELSIGNDAVPNSRAHDYIDEMTKAPSRSVHSFAKGHRATVVLDNDRNLEFSNQYGKSLHEPGSSPYRHND
jgi:hypothetical protein